MAHISSCRLDLLPAPGLSDLSVCSHNCRATSACSSSLWEKRAWTSQGIAMVYVRLSCNSTPLQVGSPLHKQSVASHLTELCSGIIQSCHVCMLHIAAIAGQTCVQVLDGNAQALRNQGCGRTWTPACSACKLHIKPFLRTCRL